MYTTRVGVTVGIREFRRRLGEYLQRVKGGEEVLITHRGKPVAKVVPVERESKWEELVAGGVITPARRPWRPIELDSLLEAEHPLSEEIIRQRRLG